MRACVWMNYTSASGAVCVALVVVAAIATGCNRPIQVQPQVIDDAQLGARVKTALVNDAQLGARIIEVRVTRGVVTLSGVVGSADEAARAVDVAGAVPGVADVRSQLIVGDPIDLGAAANPADVIEPTTRTGVTELSASRRRLFAIGASFNTRHPSESHLQSGPSVGPLVRLGTGRGLGLAVGFSWFNADLFQGPSTDLQGRITIRPVMGGASYTVTDDARWAMSLSLVGGMSFNSFTFEESAVRDGLPLEVDNSLAVRPGVSFWLDLNSRAAFNVFTGYVITRPEVTFLEGGQFTRRALRADTAVFSIGLAYKLF